MYNQFVAVLRPQTCQTKSGAEMRDRYMSGISLWKEEYKIGNEQVDAQHKELFVKIENLLDIATTGDEEANRKECLKIIDFLVSYTVYHFESEEALQRELNYISYAEHVKIHEQFKNTVLGYKEKVESDFSRETLKRFAGTLMTWLMMHVCNCDRKIVKNVPIGANIHFDDAGDLIRKMTIKLLAESYAIAVNSARTSVYNGYVEGKVIVRTIINGDKKHVFLYGFSEEMARVLYKKISGMEIGDIRELNAIESSALVELGNIFSSHVIAVLDQDNRTQFRWQGDAFLDRYTDTGININNDVVLEFDTECGRLEVLYCIAE